MNRTTALILETNNLQGDGATSQRIVAGLGRLLTHLSGQRYPLSALTELVVTHEGFSREQMTALEATAGRSIRFVQVPDGTGYYEAKNIGFDTTTSDVVVFGDGDCWPEAQWLARLLEPFDSSDAVQVVAGRTTYRDDVFGAAATAIDFMYFHPPAGPRFTRNFYANNVAFRRDTFATYRYRPLDGVYRGHCQMLGMRLREASVPIHFEPGARTTHRFPDTARELFELRLLRGQDTVELSPHLAQAYLPRALRGLGRARFAALCTLGIRWVYSLRSIGRQDMRSLRVGDYVTCIAAMTGLSLVDAAGAVQRGLFRARAASQRDDKSLSYHQDLDDLSDARAA